MSFNRRIKKCDTLTQWNITQLLKKDTKKFADKWLTLEIIILSEVTQTQKDKHSMNSLTSEY